MARYRDPVCKLCRREGVKLFLKGDRCQSPKCPMEGRKIQPPGEHGLDRRRPKKTEYGLQLREKQKIRRFYGILEKQFRLYYKRASQMRGVTGENLLQLLESRLDNVVYRIGFAPSRAAARQMVRHRHILINGKTVDIPSAQAKPGDLIRVREKSRKNEMIHESMKKIREGSLPEFLDLDKAKMEGIYKSLPTRDQVQVDANEQLVVELYSK
ncbi:30S ribosomal protein S4 [bacterium]|nr:30S ribosomal protein S4 [bacterium]